MTGSKRPQAAVQHTGIFTYFRRLTCYFWNPQLGLLVIIIPTRKQWKAWSLPSKYAGLGVIIGLLSIGLWVLNLYLGNDGAVALDPKPPKDLPELHGFTSDNAIEISPTADEPQVLPVVCDDRIYVTSTPVDIERIISGVNKAHAQQRYNKEYRGKWIRVSGPATINPTGDVVYIFGSPTEQAMLRIELLIDETEKILLHQDGDSIVTEAVLSWKGVLIDGACGRVLDDQIKAQASCDVAYEAQIAACRDNLDTLWNIKP